MLRDVDVRSTTMAPPAPAYPYAAQVQPDSNGMATAGGVLGIVALPVSWIPVFGWFLGLPLGILAVVFGAIGMARSGKLTAATGRGLAITGLVLGIATLALKILATIVLPVLLFV